jgi:predicted nucleic acid-binding Zn finger protein
MMALYIYEKYAAMYDRSLIGGLGDCKHIEALKIAVNTNLYTGL